MKRVALSIALALVTASAAFGAATGIEKFQKQVRKFAIPSTSSVTKKAKGLCVCLADTNPKNAYALGTLTHFISESGGEKRVTIVCFVKYADLSGTILDAEACNEWVPLAK